ncbi:MAG: outer membrane protein insertion porin family [Candidatus Pelagisphaera sp.]|jgi:outer membrane protein insertion porin family
MNLENKIGTGEFVSKCLLVKGACMGLTLRSLGCVFAWVFAFFLIAGTGAETYAESESEGAKWSVKGGGFFKNRKLKQQLNLIFGEEAETFNSSDIEDAALILISYLEKEGYLAAKTIATLSLVDGSEKTVEWDSNFDVFLSRDTMATSVRFELIHGPRFYYESLSVEKSEVLSVEEVEAFFFSQPLMFQSEKARLFTPGLLQGGKVQVQAHLNSLGFKSARVEATFLEKDEATGACKASVRIEEGPRHFVGTVLVEGLGDTPNRSVSFDEFLGKPYSRFVIQDISRELRNEYYALGYPDAVIESKLSIGDEVKGEKSVEIAFIVISGPQVFVSSISISGSEDTKPSLIRSRLRLHDGDLLNPSLLEGSRLNLSRLGVFDKVSYDIGDVDENHRSIKFNLAEKTTWNVDTILGWGSYEQLRGGLSVEKLNLFGMGHRVRMKTVMSVKSRLGEFRYLVPEVFGTPTSLSAKVFDLEREGVAFDREDFGLDIGLSRKVDRLGLDVDVLYSIKNLDLRKNELVDELANQGEVTVGSFELRLGRDRRDSALNPREGYRVFSNFEWADQSFGGEVNYQRAEMGISFHDEISRGLFWHAGFTNGVVGSLSESQKQVPASMLFYPGGENSMRGYQRTGAAPREGEKFSGAFSYLLLNLEMEQSLSNSLSFVLFVDALGTAVTIDDYPFNERLTAAGAGIRLRTFMGPIRLEYGHNLDPREFDPKGTLHFALGYPF